MCMSQTKYICNDDDTNAAFDEVYELMSKYKDDIDELNENFFIWTPEHGG